jgi:hypothetical protein
VACLGKILDEAARSVVFLCDGVDRDFVADVAELEGGVSATIDTGEGDFIGCSFSEGGTGLNPGGCQLKLH